MREPELAEDAYVRPGWTGEPAYYSDGTEDVGFAQCPSCLSFHAAEYISCNGKREPCDSRCTAVIGEIRCDRPANHLGEHDARSSLLTVSWRVLSDRPR